MKQLTLTILAACIIPFDTFSQYQITPAVGVGNVKIGMSMEHIIKIIGKPSSIVSYESEKEKWESNGYKTTTETVFTIPFDKVYVFDRSNDHAVWKIYSLNGKAVILNICKLVLGMEELKDIKTADGLGFNQDSAAITKCMGNDYSRDPDKNVNFVYRQKGISFVLVDNKLNNIFIYKAVNKREIITPCQDNENLYVIAGLPATLGN